MKTRVVMTAVVVAVAALNIQGDAQSTQPSLGEVARQTEARRSAVTRAAKIFTNADLKGEPMAAEPSNEAAAAPAGGYVSKSTGQPVSADEMVEASLKKLEIGQAKMDERYWRREAESLRLQLESAREKAASYQGAPAAPSVALQRVAAKQRAQAEEALAQLEKRWTALEESARYAQVPPAWLQPQ